MAEKIDKPPRHGYKHQMSLSDDAVTSANGLSAGPLRTDRGPRVLDTHVHLWDSAVLVYPWLTNEPALRREYRLADLDPVARGLAGLVVVEAGCHPDHALGEVEWVKSQAAQWPHIRGMVAQAPLERGPAAIAGLVPHLGGEGRLVVGVRRNVQDETPGFMTDFDFVAGVNALAAHAIPFDACVREHQLRELTELVDRAPAIVFVLDHLGKPDIRMHGRAVRPQSTHGWFGDIARLARRPNAVVKLSGLTTEADHERWRDSDLRPYLAHAIETFGPSRCLYGSDWPVATLATTYERWRHIVDTAIADLPDTVRAEILGGNAERIYRLT